MAMEFVTVEVGTERRQAPVTVMFWDILRTEAVPPPFRVRAVIVEEVSPVTVMPEFTTTESVDCGTVLLQEAPQVEVVLQLPEADAVQTEAWACSEPRMLAPVARRKNAKKKPSLRREGWGKENCREGTERAIVSIIT